MYYIETIPDRQKESLWEYVFYCASVSTFIEIAIEKFSKYFETQLTDEQNKEVEYILMFLHKANIVSIEKAIDRAEVLMIEYKLYPQ